MEAQNRTNIITLAILGAILVLIGVVAFSVYRTQYKQEHAPDIARTQADESISYTDVDGNPVDLLSYSGTPLIVNVWATWSPFSKNELLAYAEEKRAQGEAFNVIALNRKEHPNTVKAYLAEIGNVEGIIFVQDDADHFFSAIDGYAMPETIYYDAEGNIVAHIRGNQTKEEIKKNIALMLVRTDE